MAQPTPSFFDKYPRFYVTGNTGAGPRLNARHEVLIQRHVEHIQGRTILDVGSHDGRWAFAALHAGAKKVIGIEPRRSLVDAAIETFLEYGIGRERFEFHVAEAQDFLGRNEIQAETIFLFGILYHVHDHVRLFKEIWKTGARSIIVDTHVALDREPEAGMACAVSLKAEKVDDISNGSEEIFPGAGIALVGVPSPRAVAFLLECFQFQPSEVRWQPFLDKWGRDALKDYAAGARRTFLGVRAAPK